jgi:hypothetical protein
MRSYGLPREASGRHCDKGELLEYSRATRVSRRKRGIIKGKNKKRAIRRLFKKKARREGQFEAKDLT